METNFKVGDAVQVVNGGPMMTVQYINRHLVDRALDEIYCIWFDRKDRLQRHAFSDNTLRHYQVDPRSKAIQEALDARPSSPCQM